MQCRQHSKIFPGTVLKPRLDLELGEIRFLDAIPIILSLVIVILNSSSMGEIVKCIDLVMFRAVYMPYLHGQ